jgi:Fusaric acid resistance protein-like
MPPAAFTADDRAARWARLLPTWFRGSLAVDSVPAPWRDSVRSAVTVPVVAGAAYAIAGPGAALYAALSALLIVLSERSGTTGQRTLRSGLALLAGVLAMVLGPYTAGAGLAPLLDVLAFGLLSGVLSALGSGSSFAAMQLLVQMAVAGGVRIDVPVEAKLTAYVVGGVVALSGMWLQSALERTDRLYVAALVEAVDALSASATPAAVDRGARRRLADTRLAAATQLILTARPVGRRRRARLAVYRSVLGRVSVLAAVLSGRPVDARAAGLLRDYAVALAEMSPPGRAESGAARRRPAQPCLPGGLAELLPGLPEPPSPIPVRHIVSARLGDRRSWFFVTRLLLCLLVAELLRQITPVGHSYWIVLTVGLCLKPDFASVFSRSLQRGVGTAAGVAAGWVATFFGAGYAFLPILAALCAAIPWAVRRNYWVFSVIITPVVLLLLDYGGPVGPDVLLQRLVNTATGCAVVLVVGYALVPATWWPPIDRERARIEAELDRLSAASPVVSTVDRSLRRASIAAELRDMRDRAAQARAEPAPIRERAGEWARQADLLEESLVAVTDLLAIDGSAGHAVRADPCLRRGDDHQSF